MLSIIPLIVVLLSAAVLETAQAQDRPRRDGELMALLQLNCRDKAHEQRFQSALESTAAGSLRRAEILVLYSQCLLRAKHRASDAVPLLKEAAQILPSNAGVYRYLGTAYFLLGTDQAAIDAYEQSIELTPDAYTYAQLGLTYMRSVSGPIARNDPESYAQHLARSEDNLRQALRLTPSNPVFHSQLGSCLILQGKREEGISKIQRAIDLIPTFKEWQSDAHRAFALADLYLSLGQVYWRAGQQAEGERLIQQAIEKAPNKRAREHLKLLGDMTMGRISPTRRKDELRMSEEGMRKVIFNPFEEEASNAQ